MDRINKAIIFDSGTIINFALNGLFQEIEELKKIFKGKFLITKEVKREIIDKPLEIKKFELEALKIKELLDKKIFEMPTSVGINEEQLTKETEIINNKANSIFLARGNYIHIVDLAESSCLALSKKLNSLNIENLIAVDERTIRILSEKPENLVKILESKLHTKIIFSQEKLYEFMKFNFIRSTEIMYIAYKKDIIKIKDKRLLDALLYALKYHGCSISDEEIQEIKKLD
jgi:hypothetical protein